MNLVEIHIIDKSHSFYDECEKVCFNAKNVYNMALYNFRQNYFEYKDNKEKRFLDFKDNYHLIKNVQKKDYESLPRKCSNQVIKLFYQNVNSFFKAIKAYEKNPSKFNGRPKLPKYKDSLNGRIVNYYEKGSISMKELDKGYIKLSGTNILIKTSKANRNNIVGARVVPMYNSYKIEVIYKVEEKEIQVSNRKAAIDLGLNNLATLVTNLNLEPVIFDGRKIKSINHYFNHKYSRLRSEFEIKNKKGLNIKSSKRMIRMSNKRKNKIKDYLHKISSMIVTYLVSNEITELIIGYNKNWKQNINLGTMNNQNFVNIPHYIFVQMLEYKCKLEGIEVIKQQEAYTSLCSFLDGEKICKHKKYQGNRLKTKLFQTSNGRIINADVNGAFNILKKADPNAFDEIISSNNEGLQALAVVPRKRFVKNRFTKKLE